VTIFPHLRGEDFTIFGDGAQTRSFCYVRDEVRGLLALLESDYALPMNLGNPVELTILDFAEAVRRAARACGLPGAEARLTHRPFPENDPKQRQPDIRKAREILGWQPETSLDQGLRETLAWFLAHRVAS